MTNDRKELNIITVKILKSAKKEKNAPSKTSRLVIILTILSTTDPIVSSRFGIYARIFCDHLLAILEALGIFQGSTDRVAREFHFISLSRPGMKEHAYFFGSGSWCLKYFLFSLCSCSRKSTKFLFVLCSCSRSRTRTYSRTICVFFHPWSRPSLKLNGLVRASPVIRRDMWFEKKNHLFSSIEIFAGGYVNVLFLALLNEDEVLVS